MVLKLIILIPLQMREKKSIRRMTPGRRANAVEAYCRVLAERYRPLKITLFGSHAAGTARWDSDVDLLVEMKQVESGLSAAAAIVRETKPRFAVDLLVRTPEQVRERIRLGDSFMSNIVHSGRVVYEAAHR